METSRRGLDARLADLEARVTATRRALDPERLFESPWVRLGLAAAIGFVAGYARESAPLKTGLRVILSASAKELLVDAFRRTRTDDIM